MADIKISDLTAAASATANQQIEVNDGGVSKRITVDQVKTYVGAQPADATLTALAGVATAADKVPYFTGTDTASTATLTAFGRSVIDDTTAAEARTTLGLAAVAASGSASDLTTGTVATARLGSGTANSTTYLRGDQTWAAVSGGFSGANVQTSATDITLTNTSPQYQQLSFTADGKYVVLPDASTMQTIGWTPFIIDQKGPFTAELKLSNGVVVSGDGFSELTLSSNNANQSGWGNYGQSFGAGYVGSVSSLSSTTTGAYVLDAKWLTSTTFVVAFTTFDGTNRTARAVVGSVSGTTVTFGSPITIVTGTQVSYVALCVLSSTLVGVAVNNGTSDRVYPISVSGTTLTLGTSSAAIAFGPTISLVTLSSTTALLVASDVRVVTFSGTSAPTFGTAAAISGAVAVPQSAILLDTNKVVFATTQPALYVATVSGTTVTVGTVYDRTTLSSTPGVPFKISTTEIVLFDGDANRTEKYTISGTTLTFVGATSRSGDNFGANTSQPFQYYIPCQVSTSEYVSPWLRATYDSTNYRLTNRRNAYLPVARSNFMSVYLLVDSNTILTVSQTGSGLSCQFIDLIG